MLDNANQVLEVEKTNLGYKVRKVMLAATVYSSW
jgi:hypothetical protein